MGNGEATWPPSTPVRWLRAAASYRLVAGSLGEHRW